MLYAILGVLFGLIGMLVIEAIAFYLLFVWKPNVKTADGVTSRERVYRWLFWASLAVTVSVAVAGLAMLLFSDRSRRADEIWVFAQVASVAVHMFVYWRCDRLGIMP